MNCKRGFGGVEFIVVVVIVLIVFSIILTACLSANRRANQTSCLLSINQLSKALMMYADDNDEMMPLYAMNVSPAWTISTRPYAAKANAKGEVIPPYICRARSDKGYGFGLNIWVAEKKLIGNYNFSKIIMIADCAEVTDGEWWTMDKCAKARKVKNKPILECHGNYANVAFLDGSVRKCDTDNFDSTNWYFGN